MTVPALFASVGLPDVRSRFQKHERGLGCRVRDYAPVSFGSEKSGYRGRVSVPARADPAELVDRVALELWLVARLVALPA